MFQSPSKNDLLLANSLSINRDEIYLQKDGTFLYLLAGLYMQDITIFLVLIVDGGNLIVTISMLLLLREYESIC